MADELTSSEQANLSNPPDNIDVGGGYNPAGSTGPASDAASTYSASDVQDMGTITVTAPAIRQQPLENPLYDYDSYTYGISLHLLDIGVYNSLVQNPSAQYQPISSNGVGTVLVASGGRYAGYTRNIAFTEDFYFDNLRMSTVINTTVRNKNSNLVECSFTLIEPSGFTFINRLIAAAESINGYGNYIKMPYLLQIDFYGYRNGELLDAPIPNMSKMIPVNLIEMKSRVTAKGTEYAIKAVPYNHQAFNQANTVSPADFLIKAKTVQDVFGTGNILDTTVQASQNEAEIQRQESELQRLSDQNPEDRANLQNQISALRNKARISGQFNISGFTDALNSWWVGLLKSGTVRSINEIKVNFDAEIGESALYPSTGVLTVQQVAAGGNANVDQRSALQTAGGLPKNRINFTAGTMTVPAGTSITTLIDWAVRNSSYITKQLKDPSKANSLNPAADNSTQLNAPLRWYKIVPKVSVTAYDASTNSYNMSIEYNVKTWTVNSKHPFAPLGRAPGWVKEYNYLYTGKNKDILDLQIDFNMMYYTQATATRSKAKIFDTAKSLGDPNLTFEGDGNPYSQGDIQQGGPVVINYGRLQPVPVVYSSNNVKNTDRAGANQAQAVAAGDVKESLVNDARGDMITLKMKIIGDPHFIKQDDIFYNQTTAQSVNLLTPNGSLYTDTGELYVYVDFKFPVDYDESTGLAVGANTGFNRAEWAGVYKVIKVDNEFRSGKFEQTLELARLAIPDELMGQNNNVQQRLDTLNILALGQINPFQAIRFVGPNILAAAIGAIPAYNQAVAAAQAGGQQMQSLLAMASQQVVAQSVAVATQAATTSAIKAINRPTGTTPTPGSTTPGSPNFVGPMPASSSGSAGPNWSTASSDVPASDARATAFEAKYQSRADAATSTQYGAFGEDPRGNFNSANTTSVGGIDDGGFNPADVPVVDLSTPAPVEVNWDPPGVDADQFENAI